MQHNSDPGLEIDRQRIAGHRLVRHSVRRDGSRREPGRRRQRPKAMHPDADADFAPRHRNLEFCHGQPVAAPLFLRHCTWACPEPHRGDRARDLQLAADRAHRPIGRDRDSQRGVHHGIALAGSIPAHWPERAAAHAWSALGGATATLRATVVGTGFTALGTTLTSFDFNPTVDRVRVACLAAGPVTMAGVARGTAQAIHAEEDAASAALSAAGADRLGDASRILTICNTGALATGGEGSALGVVRELHRRRAAAGGPPESIQQASADYDARALVGGGRLDLDVDCNLVAHHASHRARRRSNAEVRAFQLSRSGRSSALTLPKRIPPRSP